MTLLTTVPIVRVVRDVAFNQDIKAIVPSSEVDGAYLHYSLLAAKPRLIDAVDLAGHGTGKLPTDLLTALPLALPPLPVQRSIARILGALDDKIELNRKMNETLEQMARAIFKSWFIDFEPFRDKGMVDSELGRIPKGWGVESLADVASLVKGASYSSDDLQPSRVALVTLKSFQRGGGYRPDGLKAYTGKYKPEQVIEPGEVVLSFTDVTQAAEVIGRPAIVRSAAEFDVLVASLDVGIVRPQSGRVSTPYLYFLLGAQEFTDHILSYVNGTTVLHLDKQGIPLYRFVCPPESVAKVYEGMAAPMLWRIDALESESRLLAVIRDALLPKLMSGEVCVKGVEGG
jgi:type I restriction enzyme S subunit